MTLVGRLSAIAQAHALLRLPFDLRDPELRKTLQGIALTHGTRLRPQRQAADIIKLAGICGEIRVGDLTFGPHGLSVFLPHSKADQIGEGQPRPCRRNPLASHYARPGEDQR